MAGFRKSSAKGVVQTVEENPAAKKERKKKLSGASGVNIVAKFRLVSFAATRVATYMDPDDVERRRLRGGRGKRGRLPTGIDIEEREPNASVARTPDAYIRRITDTSSTCLHDSPSAMSGQGRGIVVMLVMAVMLVMLRVLSPANCTSRCTPSRPFSVSVAILLL